MKFVKSEKNISTKHNTLGDIELSVEVPQIEGEANAFYEEFVAFCGSAKVAEDFINRKISDDAKQGGRAAMKAIPDTGVWDEAAQTRVQGVVKGFTPQSTDGREIRAKKVQAFDSIEALLKSGKDVSAADLLKMLELAK